MENVVLGNGKKQWAKSAIQYAYCHQLVTNIKRSLHGECCPWKETISNINNSACSSLSAGNKYFHMENVILGNKQSANSAIQHGHCQRLVTKISTSTYIDCRPWQSTCIENWLTWAFWAATIFPEICKLSHWMWDKVTKESFFSSSPPYVLSIFCEEEKTRREAFYKTMFWMNELFGVGKMTS